jgi:hypothetical protein
MIELTTISTALSTIKSAYDLSKLISDSSDSLEQAGIKLKLSELINSLADAKIQISDIKDILIEKDNEINKLKNIIQVNDALNYEKPYYWMIKDDKKDGPYCQLCYDKNKQLIRLQTQSIGSWRCLSCDKYFEDKNYIDPFIEDDY